MQILPMVTVGAEHSDKLIGHLELIHIQLFAPTLSRSLAHSCQWLARRAADQLMAPSIARPLSGDTATLICVA